MQTMINLILSVLFFYRTLANEVIGVILVRNIREPEISVQNHIAQGVSSEEASAYREDAKKG